MKISIRKIGNSKGIIIPKSVLEQLGSPDIVELTVAEDKIVITPTTKAVRRKPRDKDESEGLFLIMESEVNNNLKSGKVKWIGNREMVRKI